ncbi:NERD domain-containing protein [Neobacillus niacini]|uniref:NERD domain-containing protein n=1 Tax=Neobacillus niacini TaxID=86668 RepID=UPI0021CB0223|nr:NERD domain-containing protein [Neobacillus niacini]MCM3768734.1 NERD domain-containing protein [Neobacillus niacini]
MLNKQRKVPKELLKMRSLNARMVLSELDLWNYLNAEKGFAGELKFDEHTRKLQSNCIIINGLLLKINNKYFQIDTVLIFQKKIYLIDVKNYEGEYIYEHKKLKTKAGKEIDDPLLQLQRCESLFRQILQQYRLNFHIESYLVYINPEFTLYQAPLNDSVILPTKFNHFMKKLNTEFSYLNGAHEQLADLLMSLDLGNYPFTQFPTYTQTDLKKGIICFLCHKLSTFLKGDKIVCTNCGVEEHIDSAVLRSIKELILLFPEQKITTIAVFDWCGMVGSKKMIHRILMKNYTAVGRKRHTYYV